jgi:tetratricopeptide (TPR) repeat protein
MRRGLSAFHVGDSSIDVRAVFSWSYDALTEPAKRLFRLLGPHPGTITEAGAGRRAIASIAADADALVAELTRTHLLTEPSAGRYGFHDLLRTYAIEMADRDESRDEREAAHRRTLDHYLHTAYAAAMLLSPHRSTIDIEPASRGVTPEPLGDRDAALRWFAEECDVLLAAAAYAGRAGFDTHAWQLAWALADFLELRGHYHDWIAVQTNAVASARRLGAPMVVARMLLILGNAHCRAGSNDDGLPPLIDALEVFRELDDLSWQARTENTIGGLMEREGRYADALAHAERSLDLYRRAGDREGEARSHNSIGWCHGQLGDHERAAEHCRQALQRYEELGDRPGQAATWDSLGYAHHGLQRYAEAIRCYQRALDLVRETGDRYNEAGVLSHLGAARDAAGGQVDAVDAWRQALAILEELDHPDAAHVRARLTGTGAGTGG